jgi:hypothetical protein
MTIFERLVEYTAAFDPKFPAAIAGALPEQIAELESLLGGPPPEIYHDFLRVMGHSMDWIKIRRMDLRIETVLGYYRRENWLPRNRFIRIGEEHEEPRLHPYLMIDYPPEEPTVVCFPACRPQEFDDVISSSLEPLAGSLQELVAMPVFRTFEVRAGGRVPDLLREPGWRAGAIRKAEDALAALGFERLWFSSAWGQAYRSRGAAIEVTQHIGYPLEISVTAGDERERERLSGELLRSVPELRRMGRRRPSP